MKGSFSWLILAALILSLGFGQLLRFELWGVPLLLPDLLCLLAVILLLPKASSCSLSLGLRLLLVGLVLGWVRALTLYPLTSLALPALYSLRLVTYFTLAMLLPQSPPLPRQLFVVSAFTAVAIGLLQYLFFPDWTVLAYLGWDDHSYRLIFPHLDPTFSAAFLVLVLLSLPLPPFLIPVFIMGIFLSYARSVWLALLPALFLRFPRRFLPPLILGSVIILVLLPRHFGESTNLLRTFSFTSRLAHDHYLASRVGTGFWTGLGYNTLPLLWSDAGEYPSHVSGFNNTYLTLLSTVGPLGLFGFLFFLRDLTRSRPALFSALIFLLLGSFFNNLLLYPHLLLWLILLAKVPTST